MPNDLYYYYLRNCRLWLSYILKFPTKLGVYRASTLDAAFKTSIINNNQSVAIRLNRKRMRKSENSGQVLVRVCILIAVIPISSVSIGIIIQ